MQIDSNKVNGVSHPMGIRRNFFEQIERDLDLRAEYQKIETAVCSEQYGHGTLNSIISDSFMLWPKRDTFMSFKELRDHLGFPVSRQSGTPFFTAAENLSLAKFFTYCEMIENLIVDLNLTSVMCNEMLSGPDVVEKVRSVIRLDIAKANCEFKPIDRGMIICEKNPAATAVAEIVPQDLAHCVIEYNHYLLKGDLQRKKEILLALGAHFEPERSKLERLGEQVVADLFFLLNNVNVRHNNTQKNGPYYKPCVAEMSRPALENWYDETYQLALLAELLLNNEKRHEAIDSLKKKMKPL